MKKSLLLPPVIPVTLLLGFCVYCLIEQWLSLPSQQDWQVGLAAVMVFMLAPFWYAVFLAVNLLNWGLERVVQVRPGFSTGALIICGSAVLFKMFFAPGVDGTQFIIPIALGSFAGAAIIVLPMRMWRHRIAARGRKVVSDPEQMV